MTLCKILIVEDHPAMRRVLRQIFEQTGEFEVVAEAVTAAQALNLARSSNPELAIVDLRLPDQNGVDLIAQLRHASPALNIIVFSSVDERIHASQVRKAGAQGFVSKNREPDELLAGVRLVLAGYTCFPVEESTQGNAGLSAREMTVLRQLIRGTSNNDIAGMLNLSPKTISTYKLRIMQKLKLRTVVDLVEYAKANGLND